MLHWPESTCFWQTETCSRPYLTSKDRTTVLMDWPIQLVSTLQEHKILTTLWSWLVCSLPLSPKAVLHTMSNFPTAFVTFCFKIKPFPQKSSSQCNALIVNCWWPGLLTFHMWSLVSKCKKCTRLQGERNTGISLWMQSSLKISNQLQSTCGVRAILFVNHDFLHLARWFLLHLKSARRWMQSYC